MTGSLSRRGIFARLSVALAATALGARAASAATGDKPRVAYHLSDLEKVAFALGNIGNHIEGEGGAGKVDIVLVVNGPALAAFRSAQAVDKVKTRLAALAADGVTLGACGNTLDAQKITVADLLPGFVRIEEGGVVRLARLQAEGYAYIRP
jgi:intracellular sulfur oxidation DsrE/DsrF family protein